MFGPGEHHVGVLAENCVLWCDWGKCLEVWAGHRPCLIENVTYRNIACTVMDNIVCDVTTWFASPDTRIRNVTVEDIEVDFARTRYAPHYQKSRDGRGTFVRGEGISAGTWYDYCRATGTVIFVR